MRASRNLRVLPVCVANGMGSIVFSPSLVDSVGRLAADALPVERTSRQSAVSLDLRHLPVFRNFCDEQNPG